MYFCSKCGGLTNERRGCAKCTKPNKKQPDPLVECPFCSGSKVTAFTRNFKDQECTECNKDGLISKAKLKRLDLI